MTHFTTICCTQLLLINKFLSQLLLWRAWLLSLAVHAVEVYWLLAASPLPIHHAVLILKIVRCSSLISRKETGLGTQHYHLFRHPNRSFSGGSVQKLYPSRKPVSDFAGFFVTLRMRVRIHYTISCPWSVINGVYVLNSICCCVGYRLRVCKHHLALNLASTILNGDFFGWSPFLGTIGKRLICARRPE